MTRLFLAIMLLLLGCSEASAAAPAVEGVVSRYVAWRGGAAYRRLQSTYVEADVEMAGLKGVTREWRDRRGRSRDELDLGVLKQATAVAKESWGLNEGVVTPVSRFAAEDRRREVALEFGLVLGGGDRVTRELLPDEEMDGRRWSVVRYRFGDKDRYDLILDAATGALHGKRITRDSRTTFVRLGDWRLVDGVRLPFLREEYRASGKLEATIRVRSVAVNRSFPDALFARPASARTVTFADGAHGTGAMKFHLVNGVRIYIPSTINGQPVEVLLDSGADGSVLDRGFSERIGLKTVGSSVVTGTGGETESGWVNDLEVRIGNMDVAVKRAAVIDFSDVAKRLAIPLPMVLGHDVFNQTVVEIDAERQTIAFHDPATFHAPAGARKVPLEPLSGLRVVPVSVEGRPEAPMIFDIGNGGYMSLTPAYWQENRLLEGRRTSTRMAGAVGGEREHKVGTLRRIRFAGTNFRDVPVEFTSPEVATDSDREGGNVGMPLLGRFRMFIDFSRSTLWLVPIASRIDQPFPRDRAGLRTVQEGDRLQVRHVAAGSPAEAAGWKAGDSIVAIDGKAVTAGGDADWARGPAGSEVVLTMADGSIRRLHLADYF
jgi:hypothetical protein